MKILAILYYDIKSKYYLIFLDDDPMILYYEFMMLLFTEPVLYVKSLYVRSWLNHKDVQNVACFPKFHFLRFKTVISLELTLAEKVNFVIF